MKITWFVLFLFTLTIQALALEIVIMDYEDVNYQVESGELVSYEYEDAGCSCVCDGY